MVVVTPRVKEPVVLVPLKITSPVDVRWPVLVGSDVVFERTRRKSVTTTVDQVVASADATDAIVNGFKVSLPGPPTPTPPPTAPGLPQSPSQSPSQLGAQGAQPALPQLLGVPG